LIALVEIVAREARAEGSNLEPALIVARGIEVPREEIEVDYSRSSGPGGQHVNKTETRVTLRFDLAGSPSIPEGEKTRMLSRLKTYATKSGELLVSCEAYRDRTRNLSEAYERLEALLARAYEKPKPRKKTKPSRGAKERRLAEKKRTSTRKEGRKSPRGED
jgi:ribosome-associated protein